MGGAEIAVREITDRLALDYEWDLIMVRPNRKHPKFERVGNINIYRVGFSNSQVDDLSKLDIVFRLNKILYPILAFIKGCSLHRKRKYGAVWSIMAAYAGLAGLFFKVLNPDVKFILTLQEGDSFSHIKKRAGSSIFLFKKIFKEADYIQAISNYLVSFAREFSCEKDIVVIPNGVDFSKFTEKSAEDSRSGRFSMITTSRLVEKNGLRDLILSLNYLDKSVYLSILGTGSLLGELISLVSENKLEDRVNFLGTLNQTDMVSHLKQSDVFIRPSLSEGLGNSFLEAMAVGLPIIGTEVGGIVDFLVDGKTGLSCRVNDPKDIAQKVGIIKSDSNLRLELVKNAKKLVAERYDWEHIVGRFKSEIFDKIV